MLQSYETSFCSTAMKTTFRVSRNSVLHMFLFNCDIKHLIRWQRCYFLSVVWVICFQTGTGPKPLRVLPLEQGLESAKASPWMLFGWGLCLNEMQGDWKVTEPKTELGREVSHHPSRSHTLDADLPQVAHALNSPTACRIHFIYLFCLPA